MKCRGILCFVLMMELILPPGLFAQQANIPGLYSEIINNVQMPVNTLPQLKTDGVAKGISGISQPEANKLVVHQDQNKAIIDWESFNIGEEAWTHFDQQGNTDWTALNRIYDSNPSLIFGQLTADGRVFLINRNGILFGPGSQVDVYGIAASSLDIAEAELEKELEGLVQNDIDFASPQFSGDEDRGAVSNHGDIQTGIGGFVYLTAPEVENAGSIDSPLGQVALAAGTDVHMLLLDPSYETQDRIMPHVYVTPGQNGTAVNSESGRISADGGVAGIYGRNVNQSGFIRSITAISNSGRIELHASDKVFTGPDSITESPVSDDPEEVHQSFELTGGIIDIAGLDQKNEVLVGDLNVIKNQRTVAGTIEHSGTAKATSGTISMGAENRIYLDRGSLVDVSGEWVTREAAEATITAQLNSVELKNDPVQKEGVLAGVTVEVLPEEGSSIGDLSAHLNGEFATAREMATEGGDIVLNAVEGDIIVLDGGDGTDAATIDFSGGGTTVLSGYYSTTKLVSGNQIYDISEAPTNIEYDAVINYNEETYEQFGITEEYDGIYSGGGSSLLSYTDGFIRGDDAGTLTMASRGLLLGGELDGSATRGIYQTETEIPEVMYGEYAVQMAAGVKAPRGGELIIGPTVATQEWALLQYGADEVVIASDSITMPEDVNIDTAFINAISKYRSDYQDAGGRTLFRSVIPAETLSGAGLSDIKIEATTKISVEEDAVLTLKPGGFRTYPADTYQPLTYQDSAVATLTLTARAIDIRGAISIPGGDVDMSIEETITSSNSALPDRKVEMNDRFFMPDGASISVAGERIDNSLAGELGNVQHGYIDGGSIEVHDSIGLAEAILMTGALLDVSGGYGIDTDAEITAGKAGSISLQGSTLVADADFRGHSFDYEDGGSFSMHADKITVKTERETLPSTFGFDDDLDTFQNAAFADMNTETVFEDDQLSESGFSDISLSSRYDLYITNGVHLSPSRSKLASPTPASDSVESVDLINPAVNLIEVVETSGHAFTAENGYITVPLDYLGETSISAKAAVEIGEGNPVDVISGTESVVVSPGARIEVAPEGSIELSGLVVGIEGALIAPSGEVKVAADGQYRSITLLESSIIDVSGYNRLVSDSTILNIGSSYDALDGGSVTLVAESYGNIVMAAGSEIDLSGSMPVESIFYDSDGTIFTDSIASDAGSLSLFYYGNVVFDGDIEGRAYDSQAHAASLSLTRTNWEEGLFIEQDLVDLVLDEGFDALALCSLSELVFSGHIDADFQRSLTLDAPSIRGLDNSSVSFNANAVSLVNKWDKYAKYLDSNQYDMALVGDDDLLTAGAASSQLLFSGTFIDVDGSIAVSGFSEIVLASRADISLASEQYYDSSKKNVIWTGKLRTPGDLTLKASRIYPTTYSDFTLASDTGRITTVRGTQTSEGPIVSAGGSLTLAADEIDHHGYLAAPLGSIHFRGSLQDADSTEADTVFMAEGSIVSIAGDSNVQYGYIEDYMWMKENVPSTWTESLEIATNPVDYIDILPDRQIDIDGDTIVMQSGATIDTSAGGTIYASEFKPGISGLENQLNAEHTFVIVPGIHQAGAAIHVEEDTCGLPAGTYSLLDASYAFLEGAFVVQYLGSANSVDIPTVTDEGYDVMVALETLSGTDFTSMSPGLYSIRRASDVIDEGDYTVQSLAAENGGNLELLSNTMVLDGNLYSSSGGQLSASGSRSAVVRSTSALGTGYDFEDISGLIVEYGEGHMAEEVDVIFQNTAQIMDVIISDSELGEVHIGTLEKTETITLTEDANVEAPLIQLTASDLIQLEKNSLMTAYGEDEGNGIILLDTPNGHIETGSGSVVNASRRIDVIAQSAMFSGEMSSSGGTLAITAGSILMTPDRPGDQSREYLYLPVGLTGFSGFSDLELKASESLTFSCETTLDIAGTLTIDAPVVAGASLESENNGTQLSAQNILLINSGSAGADATTTQNGVLSFEAEEDIVIGHGDILIEGYDELMFKAGRDVKLSGHGSMTTSGDTTIQASRLTTASYETENAEKETVFEATNFSFQAGSADEGYGDILIQKSNGAYDLTAGNAGGIIEMTGATIAMEGGWIDVSGGWATLTATGAPEADVAIDLSGNTLVDVSGNDYLPGGRVTLIAETGTIGIGPDVAINVSAGGQGDAGTLSLSAVEATANINGSISAVTGTGGAGGCFLMDVGGMEDAEMASLWQSLESGGFEEQIDVRVRAGDIELDAPEIINAQLVKLTADIGDISISGTINAVGDAYGNDGGSVEINAGNSLTLSGSILANACIDCSNGDGGNVWLNAVDDQLTFSSGSQIDVSSNTDVGGFVRFRAAQTGSYASGGIDMALSGEVIGASKVIVEGVKQHTYDTDELIITTDLIENTFHAQSDAFLDYVGNIGNSLILTGGQARAAKIVPGIEIINTGEITLADEWDLTELGYSAQEGSITLLAEGNISLKGSLVDHPSVEKSDDDDGEEYIMAALTDTYLPEQLNDSWSFNLVAGSDSSSADIMATISEFEADGGGLLNIHDKQVIYTENNTIRYASAGDTIIYGYSDLFDPYGDSYDANPAPRFMVNDTILYNIGTFFGDIEGEVGQDLIIMNNGAIQSAQGDIAVSVKRDLHIELNDTSGGAIRTTGIGPADAVDPDYRYAEVHDGGDIRLDVYGQVRMGDVDLADISGGVAQIDRIPFYTVNKGQEATPHLKYWDNIHQNVTNVEGEDIYTYVWSADFGESAFKNFEVINTPTAGIATMGGGSVTVNAGGNLSGQVGTFKEGDLSIFTNGDIFGYLQVADGEGDITVVGNITSPQKNEAEDSYAYSTSLAMSAAQVSISAGGAIDFGTVFNSTFPRIYAEYVSLKNQMRYLDYDYDETPSSVSMTTSNGDIQFSGEFWYGAGQYEDDEAYTVLPPSVSLIAGGDVFLGTSVVLAPSKYGDLNIHASGNIIGYIGDSSSTRRSTLRMSDLNPDDVYKRNVGVDPYDLLWVAETSSTAHAGEGSEVLHEGDRSPITITASGDILEISIVSAKETVVNAGGNIEGLYFFGQNVNSDDETLIQAGGDIVLDSGVDATGKFGLINAGGGLFLVQAGGSIDLGTTDGIQAVGNNYYSELGEESGALAVMAGWYMLEELTEGYMTAFFDGIRASGEAYSELLAQGDLEGAAETVKQADDEWVTPLNAAASPEEVTGNIEMINSNIQASGEKADVYIFVKDNFNVGATAIAKPGVKQKETGVFTSQGGAINIFANGDINVNESRVMTFRGGDISLWSDQGDINAGRGSKTAINVGSPQAEAIYDDDGNLVGYRILWEPPSVGSGVRTLTYDPDGSQGVLEAPEAGDIYLFAPAGVIDAGEAGISGSNVVLGATEVLNAQNIEVSGTSVGVPQANTGPSVAALAGAGTISEAAKSVEDAGVAQNAEDRFADAVAEISENLVPKWLAVEVIGFVEEDEDEQDE